MPIIDVHELQDRTTLNVDICIVGSGAAGLTVASELNGSAQTVGVIESGHYSPDETTQGLCDVDIVGHPVRENFMSRARYFGGTCNLWAGRNMQLTPLDVAPRAWIQESGWPIPYEEMARYYPKAMHLLRLPSLDTFERAVRQHRMSTVERCIFAPAELQPNLSMWGKKPFRFGARYQRQLQRSRNITTYLNANVTEILLNDAGNCVEALVVATLDGKKFRLQAKQFVLACGGMENARLLLASRSVHPHGIGNQFDVVGRYYMDHPRAVFGKVKLTQPQKLPLLLGIPLARGKVQVGIQFSDEMQQKESLLNNYLTLERHWSDQAAKAYQSFVHSMKIILRKGYAGNRFSLAGANLAQVPELIYLLAPRELIPHWLYRIARVWKSRLSKGVSELIVVNYCEQLPNPQSRVYLSTQRDQLNMPRLVLDWKICPQETHSLMRLHAVLDQVLRQHRLGYLDNTSEPFSERLYTDASHHIGTTRMSTDPRTGVVDPHGAVHGVQNLFLAGSSVFPTAGYANPTLTIVALAMRLAAHLKRLR
jgi:choline dehydrogenase-like flavoprotein